MIKNMNAKVYPVIVYNEPHKKSPDRFLNKNGSNDKIQVGSGYLNHNDSFLNSSFIGMNEDLRDESIIKVSPSGVIRAYKSPT